MDSTLKAQKRLDSLLGQLKAVETGNPLSRSAAGTSSGSASSYASVPEPAREEERPEERRAASLLNRARTLGRRRPGDDGGAGADAGPSAPGSTVYVALSDGRLVRLSCDLGAMASARDGISLHDLFGELRRTIGSSLHRHRYHALAKQLPMLRLQAEAVVSPDHAPLLLLEPQGGAPSRCPPGTVDALCAAEAVRVTLVDMHAPEM